MRIFTIVFLLFTCSINMFSQSSVEVSSQKKSINELNWLSGYWSADLNVTKMEEIWLPESNNTMIGLHRDSFQSGKIFFEYLRIEQSNDTIVYKASPRGKKPTSFYLKSMNNHSVVFENIEHDFPQRIMYSLNEDTLFVRIEGDVHGILKYKEWKWFKTKLHE